MKHWPSHLAGVLAVMLSLLLGACNVPQPNRTHRGNLIDDKVTMERVQSALDENGKEFARVHTEARDGVIILSGSVANQQLRSRAEEIARSLDRVQKVENNIQVGR